MGPGVFVPRPETELIAEAGVRALRDAAGGTAVDLCAGSGVIGLSLALEAPGSTVFLVEKTKPRWNGRSAMSRSTEPPRPLVDPHWRS